MFKGLPAHIQGLKKVPFEVVPTPNNHVFNYGDEGFYETKRILDNLLDHIVDSALARYNLI